MRSGKLASAFVPRTPISFPSDVRRTTTRLIIRESSALEVTQFTDSNQGAVRAEDEIPHRLAALAQGANESSTDCIDQIDAARSVGNRNHLPIRGEGEDRVRAVTSWHRLFLPHRRVPDSHPAIPARGQERLAVRQRVQSERRRPACRHQPGEFFPGGGVPANDVATSQAWSQTTFPLSANPEGCQRASPCSGGRIRGNLVAGLSHPRPALPCGFGGIATSTCRRM